VLDRGYVQSAEEVAGYFRAPNNPARDGQIQLDKAEGELFVVPEVIVGGIAVVPLPGLVFFTGELFDLPDVMWGEAVFGAAMPFCYKSPESVQEAGGAHLAVCVLDDVGGASGSYRVYAGHMVDNISHS